MKRDALKNLKKTVTSFGKPSELEIETLTCLAISMCSALVEIALILRSFKSKPTVAVKKIGMTFHALSYQLDALSRSGFGKTEKAGKKK